MSWKFLHPANTNPTTTVTIKNPEFAEVDQSIRRQAKGETDGGTIFVEDLGQTDRFIEATWRNLKPAEVGDLKTFFGPNIVNMQTKPFRIEMTTDAPLYHWLEIVSAGMSVGGEVLSAGGGYNAGGFVNPDTASFDVVFLDQAELSFAQDRFQLFSTSIRFRLHSGALPEIL